MGGSFLGFSAFEFLVFALLVIVIVGPQRLPEFAKQAANALKKAVAMVRDAKDALTGEFGEEIAELREYDPRQYDPRRIVREAMAEPRPRPTQRPAASPSETPREPGGLPPFDPDAT